MTTQDILRAGTELLKYAIEQPKFGTTYPKPGGIGKPGAMAGLRPGGGTLGSKGPLGAAGTPMQKPLADRYAPRPAVNQSVPQAPPAAPPVPAVQPPTVPQAAPIPQAVPPPQPSQPVQPEKAQLPMQPEEPAQANDADYFGMQGGAQAAQDAGDEMMKRIDGIGRSENPRGPGFEEAVNASPGMGSARGGQSIRDRLDEFAGYAGQPDAPPDSVDGYDNSLDPPEGMPPEAPAQENMYGFSNPEEVWPPPDVPEGMPNAMPTGPQQGAATPTLQESFNSAHGMPADYQQGAAQGPTMQQDFDRAMGVSGDEPQGPTMQQDFDRAMGVSGDEAPAPAPAPVPGAEGPAGPTGEVPAADSPYVSEHGDSRFKKQLDHYGQIMHAGKGGTNSKGYEITPDMVDMAKRQSARYQSQERASDASHRADQAALGRGETLSPADQKAMDMRSVYDAGDANAYNTARSEDAWNVLQG